MMKTLTLTQVQDRQRYLSQVWTLLEESYAQVIGGLHYTSKQELLEDTARWRVVTKYGQVIAVTLFKAKKGWKLTAMAIKGTFGRLAKLALQRLIKADLTVAWMELSEKAEGFVLKYCGGHHFLVHASLAARLLDKPIVTNGDDGFHYQRHVAGVVKTKVIVGSPQF